MRALGRNAELIVMDEPTAALSGPDVAALHEVIRRLARSGTTVVLVSHLLGEVLALADEVTILRDGHVVRTAAAAGQTEESLLNAMLRRYVSATFPARQPVGPDAPVVLSVRGLRAGVAMIPESRKEHGLLPRRSVRENVSLSSLGQLSRGVIVRRRPASARRISRSQCRHCSPSWPESLSDSRWGSPTA